MDKFKAKQLSEMSVDALKKLEAKLRDELRDMRFKRMSGEVKKNHLFGQKRKSIAKIKTILNTKQQ